MRLELGGVQNREMKQSGYGDKIGKNGLGPNK